MKVKVGDNVYTSEELPIMVILNEADKENIKSMPDDCFKYAQFNEQQFNPQQAKEWMKEDDYGSEDTEEDRYTETDRKQETGTQGQETGT